MTLENQIANLDRGTEEFSKFINSLEENIFLKKIDDWSPRAILAHLIGWNRYFVEASEQIRKGELPFFYEDPGEDFSNVNDELVRKYSSQEKRALLDELDTAKDELKKYLQELDQENWDRDFGVRYEGYTDTIRNLVVDLIEDYANHQHQIKDWLKGMDAH